MKIGIGEEMFKDDLDNYQLVKCVYFPMFKLDRRNRIDYLKPSKIKIKGIKENKSFMRV